MTAMASGYQSFDHAVVLDQVMRQAGQDPSQVLFRQILLRLRNGEVTEDDWKHLMTRTPAQISDISAFNDALRLFLTVFFCSGTQHLQTPCLWSASCHDQSCPLWS